MEIHVRPAVIDDWPLIVDFNCRLAHESEEKHLDRATVELGVRELLTSPHHGRYLVATVAGQVAGQLMHTFEWSDWRNGVIWWLQSVFVVPEHRGRGVFRALFDQLLAEADADPGVVGVRLYAEQQNQQALAVYEQLGMMRPGYVVMERMLRRQV